MVDVNGEALTQKRLPKLATIKPALDLEQGKLQTHSPSAHQKALHLDAVLMQCALLLDHSLCARPPLLPSRAYCRQPCAAWSLLHAL